MMLRADVCPGYFRKFLYIALACFAYSAWCLYDAFVAYPAQLEVARAYESIDKSQRLNAWPEMAKKNGWSPREPKKSAKDISDGIGKQFAMVAICALIAVPALLKWFSGQGTWVEGDETLIRNSRGQEVPLGSIVKIDKTKWPDKGIAKIHYEVDGKSKKFVMDDFKYEREPMGSLMEFAEAQVTDEQIIGDQRETQKRQEREAAEARAAEEAAAEEAEEQAVGDVDE
ncbi:MAG: hypothetical protein AAGA03_10170 [Planctomycetota bacterium]